MNHQIRIIIGLVAVILLTVLPFPAGAAMYRYVDENGVAHFTDDIQKVPENQRSGIVIEDAASESKPASTEEPAAVEPAPGKAVSVPMLPAGNTTALEQEAGVLNAKKKSLDAEFMEIIAERDRLEKERSIPGNPSEVKAYNDAVFALKDRIAAYQKQCDTYEARVKALKQQLEALEKQASPSGKPVQ